MSNSQFQDELVNYWRNANAMKKQAQILIDAFIGPNEYGELIGLQHVVNETTALQEISLRFDGSSLLLRILPLQGEEVEIGVSALQ